MSQTTLRDYLQTTEDTISSGRIHDAFSNCQNVLSQYPDSLEAQRLLGEVYLKQGKLEDAQQTFDWILTNDPENVIVYCDRALISEQQQDLDTALDCYQQAYELSRGNSQIRQKFNQLSERAGQQGFIFSRAGLARLYMRGDLLTQAIQEWEIVLSTSPERLDARTGLLETYWREGLYDRVEQLATELLQSVPGCLKALLLLAHVSYAKDVERSQEFLKQAEALDPELIMAQDLFSDMMAGQPHDPFFALVKKNTVMFPATGTHTSGTASTPIPASPAQPEAAYSDSLVAWNNLDTLSNQHQPEYPPVREASPFAAWSNTGQSDFEAWNMLEQSDYKAAADIPPASDLLAAWNQPELMETTPSAQQQP
ncbi:MAG: tetratricopeptide repeat protein, partial [Chloroflexota bacterium]|nr:tetratricopeptide repeat protein [Chloroflexota bacterium]